MQVIQPQYASHRPKSAKFSTNKCKLSTAKFNSLVKKNSSHLPKMQVIQPKYASHRPKNLSHR